MAFKQMREHRLTVTIAIVVIIFMICWFTLLYLQTAFPENNFDAAYTWAWRVALSNFSMNPLIYCLRSSEFRKAYKKQMARLRLNQNLL